MNKFDDLCVFRFAKMGDTERIMSFIRDYWSSTHILATDKDFFLFEFQSGEDLNFFLAESKKDASLQAIMGFFAYSKPQPEMTDYSGALLKVRNDCSIPLLGIEVVRRFLDGKKPRMYIGNGSNPKTALPWQKRALGHKTGKLGHYYRLNGDRPYHIAGVVEKKILSAGSGMGELVEYKDMETLERDFDIARWTDRIPYKDRQYIYKRYLAHPIYRYLLYGIRMADAVETVLITREVEQAGAKIWRIVDILGCCENIQYAGEAIDNLLKEKEYEYVDIYQHGIADLVLERAGFLNREQTPENIIPNYFEPFLQKNIDIYFHIPREGAYIFKADGDQDRPSRR